MITRWGRAGDRFELEFRAEAGNIYNVEYLDQGIGAAPWQVLTNVVAKLVSTNVLIVEPSMLEIPARFYRVADVGDVD